MNLAPPGIICPEHGIQAGRTRCQWCGFDPLRVNRRTELLPGDAALPGLSPKARASFFCNSLHVRGEVSADVFHAEHFFASVSESIEKTFSDSQPSCN